MPIKAKVIEEINEEKLRWQTLLNNSTAPEHFATWKDAEHAPLVKDNQVVYTAPASFILADDPDALYVRVAFPDPVYQLIQKRPYTSAGASGEFPTGLSIQVPVGYTVLATPPRAYANRGLFFVNGLLSSGDHLLYFVFLASTQAITITQGMPLVRLSVWRNYATE